MSPIWTDPELPAAVVPGPRDALDSGSVAELAADGRAVHVDVAAARPWSQAHHSISVPDDASALVRDWDRFGS